MFNFSQALVDLTTSPGEEVLVCVALSVLTLPPLAECTVPVNKSSGPTFQTHIRKSFLASSSNTKAAHSSIL
jgi:hypothetical protein